MQTGRSVQGPKAICLTVFQLSVFFIVGLSLVPSKVFSKELQIVPENSQSTFHINARTRATVLTGKYTVEGQFSQMSGAIQLNQGDLSNSSVQIEIPIETLVTQTIDSNRVAQMLELGAEAQTFGRANETRTAKLLGEEYFSVEDYPTATFRSTRISGTTDNFQIRGLVTIRGVRQPTTLNAELVRTYVDGEGKNHFVYEATSTLNRLDFGIGSEGEVPVFSGIIVANIDETVELTHVIDAIEVNK